MVKEWFVNVSFWGQISPTVNLSIHAFLAVWVAVAASQSRLPRWSAQPHSSAHPRGSKDLPTPGGLCNSSSVCSKSALLSPFFWTNPEKLWRKMLRRLEQILRTPELVISESSTLIGFRTSGLLTLPLRVSLTTLQSKLLMLVFSRFFPVAAQCLWL